MIELHLRVKSNFWIHKKNESVKCQKKKSGKNQSIFEGKIRGNPDIYHCWCANNEQTVVFYRFAKPAIN